MNFRICCAHNTGRGAREGGDGERHTLIRLRPFPSCPTVCCTRTYRALAHLRSKISTNGKNIMLLGSNGTLWALLWYHCEKSVIEVVAPRNNFEIYETHLEKGRNGKDRRGRELWADMASVKCATSETYIRALGKTRQSLEGKATYGRLLSVRLPSSYRKGPQAPPT